MPGQAGWLAECRDRWATGWIGGKLDEHTDENLKSKGYTGEERSILSPNRSTLPVS